MSNYKKYCAIQNYKVKKVTYDLNEAQKALPNAGSSSNPQMIVTYNKDNTFIHPDKLNKNKSVPKSWNNKNGNSTMYWEDNPDIDRMKDICTPKIKGMPAPASCNEPFKPGTNNDDPSRIYNGSGWNPKSNGGWECPPTSCYNSSTYFCELPPKKPSKDPKEIYTKVNGEECTLQWDSTKDSNGERNAKWDCKNSGDPVIIEGDKIYTMVNGEKCGLQWDANRDSNGERNAKWDCKNTGDPVIIEGNKIYTMVNGEKCGLQWDANRDSNGERNAKWDCKNSGDPVFFRSINDKIVKVEKQDCEMNNTACPTAGDVMKIPYEKRQTLLGGDNRTCPTGFNTKQSKFYNLPSGGNVPKISQPIINALTSNNNKGSKVGEQCNVESDCANWDKGKVTCNKEEQKCVQVARGKESNDGKVYDCMGKNDGVFSKRSFDTDVDPNSVCKLNGFPEGYDDENYGTYENYYDICKPQNNGSGKEVNGKFKNLATWKCKGTRQKIGAYFFDKPKINEDGITIMKLYPSQYSESSFNDLFDFQLNNVKSFKIEKNHKIVLTTNTNFHILYEGIYDETKLKSMMIDLSKLKSVMVSKISEEKKKCGDIGGILVFGDPGFKETNFKKKLSESSYNAEQLKQHKIKQIKSIKVGYGYEARLYKGKTKEEIKTENGGRGFLLKQGEYAAITNKDKFKQFLNKIDKQTTIEDNGEGEGESGLNIGYIKVIKIPSKNTGVILFQHDKFVGKEAHLEKGNYNSINLKENNIIPEKCSSSIQVLKGFTVKMYHRDNFKGIPVVLEAGAYELEELINKNLTKPIYSIKVYKKSDLEYQCVPGIQYPIRFDLKDKNSLECPTKDGEMCVDYCSDNSKIGGLDELFLSNDTLKFKCDDKDFQGNYGNACNLLKRKNPLSFSNYMEIEQTSTEDPTKPEQSSLIFDSLQKKYMGNPINVIMTKDECKQYGKNQKSKNKTDSIDEKYKYTRCKLNLSDKGLNLNLSGTQNKVPVCKEGPDIMIKAEKDVCDSIGGVLVGEDTEIYDNVLKNLSDTQKAKFRNKETYKELSNLEKALFHQEYFPQFEKENKLPYAPYNRIKNCKVKVCKDGLYSMRKKGDCLQDKENENNGFIGQGIIYATRKQCDRLGGNIKDPLVIGNIDERKYYPCRFDICNKDSDVLNGGKNNTNKKGSNENKGTDIDNLNTTTTTPMPITSTTRSVISVDQKTGEIITGKNKQTKENNQNIVSSTPLKNNKFFEYDSNKDGKMDLNEFAKAYRSFESGGITKTTTTQNIRKQGGNIFNQTEEFVGSRLQEALPSYWNRPASSEDILKIENNEVLSSSSNKNTTINKKKCSFYKPPTTTTTKKPKPTGSTKSNKKVCRPKAKTVYDELNKLRAKLTRITKQNQQLIDLNVTPPPPPPTTTTKNLDNMCHQFNELEVYTGKEMKDKCGCPSIKNTNTNSDVDTNTIKSITTTKPSLLVESFENSSTTTQTVTDNTDDNNTITTANPIVQTEPTKISCSNIDKDSCEDYSHCELGESSTEGSEPEWHKSKHTSDGEKDTAESTTTTKTTKSTDDVPTTTTKSNLSITTTKSVDNVTTTTKSTNKSNKKKKRLLRRLRMLRKKEGKGKCNKCDKNKDSCLGFWFRWMNLGLPCNLFQTKQEVTILFLYILFKIVTMIFAFYFSWSCGYENIYMIRLFNGFLSAMFSEIYLIYYFIKSQSGRSC